MPLSFFKRNTYLLTLIVGRVFTLKMPFIFINVRHDRAHSSNVLIPLTVITINGGPEAINIRTNATVPE